MSRVITEMKIIACYDFRIVSYELTDVGRGLWWNNTKQIIEIMTFIYIIFKKCHSTILNWLDQTTL